MIYLHSLTYLSHKHLNESRHSISITTLYNCIVCITLHNKATEHVALPLSLTIICTNLWF